MPPPPGSGGSDAGPPRLEGTSWRLSRWSVSSLDPAAFTITAVFADRRIGGKAAVNTYGGPYEAGSDNAFSAGLLISTRMAGPEPAMQAEAAFLGLLAGAASYLEADGTLTLCDEHGSESLVFVAAGD